MARFKINDTIELVNNEQVVLRGVVVKDAWAVDNVDHYLVYWEWSIEGPLSSTREPELIIDEPKYRLK